MTRILAVSTLLVLAAGSTVQAVDILQTSRTTYRGKVLKADAETVLIDLETGNRIGVPRASIVRSRVEPNPEVLKGGELYEKGEIAEAYAQFAKSVPRYYGLDADWAVGGAIQYGRAAIELKKYEEAEKVFRTIEKLNPKHPLIMGAYLGRAQVRLARNEYESALKAFTNLAQRFEAMLKPPPRQMEVAADLHLGTGKAAEGLSRWDAALDAYLKVVTLYPAEDVYEEALFRSAAIRVKLGEIDTAAAALDELIEEFPEGNYRAQASKLKRHIEKQVSAE
jgi:tetratricopeptide (TPR) repeat protein